MSMEFVCLGVQVPRTVNLRQWRRWGKVQGIGYETCHGSVLCVLERVCVIECVRVCLCGKCDRDVVFELIDVSHAVLRKRIHLSP